VVLRPALRHERRPGLGSTLTPAAAGGSPAAAHSASLQAATCPASAGRESERAGLLAGAAGGGPAGDHDARSSNPVAAGSPCLPPNPSVTTLVTVPLGAA